MRDLLEKITDEQQRLQDKLKLHLAPTLELIEQQKRQMEMVLEPFKRVASLLEEQRLDMVRILEPFRHIEKKLEQLWLDLPSMPAITKAAQRLVESDSFSHLDISKITDQFQQIKDAQSIFDSNNLKLFKFDQINFSGFEELSKSLRETEFGINLDGSITIEDKIYTAETIQDKIEKILENEAIDLKKDSVVKVINIFIKFARKPKDSVIIFIILGLLVNFISHNVIEPLKNKILDRNKKIIIKKIKKERFSDEIDISMLRFVSVEVLNVRKKSNRKSEKIGLVNFGDVVYLIRKKKDWSLVLYKDGEVVIQGWVFSRYLKKFRGQTRQGKKGSVL